MTEAEYCRAVAIGRLSTAINALGDATSLLFAMEHPNVPELRVAYSTIEKTSNRLYSEIKVDDRNY